MKRTIILLLLLYGVSTNAQSILLKNVDIESYNSMVEFKKQLWIFDPCRKVGSTPSSYNVLKRTDEEPNWQTVALNNGTIYPYSKTVIFKRKLYSITVHPSLVTNEAKSSLNRVNWTIYSAPFSAQETHTALVNNEKIYVIAGSANNDVWKTDDGTNCTQICSRLSSDFSHFWRSKTDWGFENNEKGTYIPTNDGTAWAKSTLSYNTGLSSSRIYFVKNNQLFIEVYTEVYRNSSFFQSLWLKVDDDLAFVEGEVPDNYGFNLNRDLECFLPDGAFSAPEGQELTFSSDDLPQGLAIHPQSGNIYGKTTQQLPFDITIKATDRYGKSAEQILNVVKQTNVKYNSPVSLYPNPCKQILNIDMVKTGTYQLFSANGMLIQIGRLKIGNNDVNLS